MIISEEKLKEALVKKNHVKEVDFDMAKAFAKNEDMDLDKALVEKGLMKDQEIGEIIAEIAGYPFVKLKEATINDISTRLLNYIPKETAFHQQAIVFEEDDKKIKVATTNPENYKLFKMLENKTGKEVKPFYVTNFDIDRALQRYTGRLTKKIEKLVNEFQKDREKYEENIVKIVDLLLEHGYSTLSSDIHIEPLEDVTVVRYRKDGVLYSKVKFPKDIHLRVVSRIKILAKLRTDEKEKAQDGGFSHEIRGAKIDLRVSIVPTTDGENIVIRLVMQRGRRFELDDLGLMKNDLKTLKRNAKKPYGMILAVGPTGSGKTTSLYALLQLMNKTEVNIVTIEDPVEYEVERVRQIQVNPAKDITFPKGLRAIVRQDPDIIMVGEIRDKETADMAINSAMTGHLVLSTLHANDAATTFSRFLEIGAKPHLLSSSINVVIAQRLVRKICPECKTEYHLSETEINTIKEEELTGKIKEIAEADKLEEITFYKGKGCKFCNDMGYDGRTAIFEILEVTEDLRELIANSAPMSKIKNQAIKNGMTTMTYDGISKAIQGTTTLKEVMRVTK